MVGGGGGGLAWSGDWLGSHLWCLVDENTRLKKRGSNDSAYLSQTLFYSGIVFDPHARVVGHDAMGPEESPIP